MAMIALLSNSAEGALLGTGIGLVIVLIANLIDPPNRK